MSKLLFLPTSRLTSLHLRSFTFSLSRLPSAVHLSPIPLYSPLPKPSPVYSRRCFSVSAIDTKNDGVFSSAKEEMKNDATAEVNGDGSARGSSGEDQYPTGEFVFEEYGAWKSFVVKLRLLFALPWQRVRKGSVLTMKLRGQVSDQLQTRFSSGLSLPQICENFIKAAYDPRISGVYLHIEPLSCGWGKVEEIRRHILDFRKSGKFIVGYAPACGEKEYYIGCACEELYAPPSAYFALYGLTVQASFLGGVLEKIGIEPLVQRIGKYKSAGDQLMRKNISEENREMLTALVDNIYGNWLDIVSLTKGKKRDDIENFINEGVYQVERLKEDGWITDIKYDDEVMSMLKERLGTPKDKKLPTVDYRKYSRVRRWTLGLAGYKDQIAVIRASGSISRVRGPFSVSSSGIIAEQFIEKIRSARESKRYKAVVIRIDSPGGDALASDLMWREIRLLAESKPVVASMADVAASGGYYMSMGAQAIVAENLTLTGSIGVVTGKFNLGNLYEKIGFNKEIISRGRFAELTAADQRSFRPDEAELFEKSAQNAYKQFRDKAAFSRSMSVDKMEEVAQGRVWTGNDAASRGLVDAIGGISRAVAIAKQKANIPQERQVDVVEMSKPSPTLPEILSGVGSSLAGADRSLKELLNELASSDGIQARMDGIMFEKLEGAAAHGNPLLMLIKDCLSSL
ncbi:PREDICTED: serine protease SPPA, chloroplastic [Ipomoea nil]|uniref:serine protease SPPA, chloroplastic n=1 Tax=Ipomoea nil TaxID=35883 RepID=UPI0009016EE6|nr:PREDICTED: serine protease SPPA, chloroplastic [Ipomoea nil]